MTEAPASTLIHRIGQSWRSSFRDMLLIVASILIAFGLEAWWDGKRTLDEERAALAAVRDDLRAARLELDTVMAHNERAVTAVRTVLAMDPAALESLDPDSASVLTRLSFGGGLTFDPTTGALQAILSGGTLADIRNDRLAAELSAWPGLLDEIEEDQGFIIDSYNRLLEVRIQTGTMEQSLIHREMLPGPADMDPTEVLEALVAGELNRGILARHMLSVRGLLQELEDVDRALDALLEQLDAELGEPGYRVQRLDRK